MLMLHLDEERTSGKTSKTRDGEFVRLSKETCEFILSYVLFCMSPAIAKIVFEHHKDRTKHVRYAKFF